MATTLTDEHRGDLHAAVEYLTERNDEWDGLVALDALLIKHASHGWETIVFGWSRNHGDCYDCGLPAAFLSEGQTLCAVCAANHAADGALVSRIEEE